MAGGVEQRAQIQGVFWPEMGEAPHIEIPQPKVQVITDSKGGKPRPRFGEQDSLIDGVRFIVESGGHVVFNRRQTRRIQADADRIARSKRYVTTATEAKKRLVALKKGQADFAGVISQRGNYRSPLYPKETRVEYNPTLLEESLGEFYPALVRVEGQLVLTLPSTDNSDASERLSDLAQQIAGIMIEQGRDPQEVGTLITPTIIQRLDEEKLRQLQKEGKVNLKPGTRKSTRTWEIATDPLNPDIKPKAQRLTPKKT